MFYYFSSYKDTTFFLNPKEKSGKNSKKKRQTKKMG